jgi:TonB-linked SusC/RagA family outer membrane protein
MRFWKVIPMPKSMCLMPRAFTKTELTRQVVNKQLMKVMKLTCLFLTIVLLQVHATGSAQSVSISGKQIPLKNVLAAIKKQTGYAIFARAELIENAKPVTINVVNKPIAFVLNEALKGQQISFQIINRNIILSEISDAVPQEKKPTGFGEGAEAMTFLLKGRVTGVNNAPLEGATVQITESQRYTNSGKDGSFILPVSEGELLLTTFVGYTDKYIRITSAMRTANYLQEVNMTAASTTLADVTVVFTGYQQLNKESASGSFAKPNMQVFKERTSSMDVMSRLDGLIPGLSVMPGTNGMVTTGQYGAGGTSRSALIRGTSSVFLNSNPLYVLNGIPVKDISSINPDDIADITVLKDAVASSIWGARAGNGVIVINTKSGSRNTSLSVGYSGFVNFQGKPDLEYGKMMSSEQYIQTAQELFNPTQFPWFTLSYGMIAPHEKILYDQQRGLISNEQAAKSLDSLALINNMGQIKDLWYRNALTTNHTVSVSGGGNLYSFYGSMAYTNIKDSRPDNRNQTFRMTLNQDLNFNSRLKVSLKTFLAKATRKSYENISIEDKFLPYQLFKDEAGNDLKMNFLQGWSDAVRADYQQRSRINLDYSPWEERKQTYRDYNALTVNVTGDVNLKIYKGLAFQGTYGYQVNPGDQSNYAGFGSYSTRLNALRFTVAPTANSTPIYYLPVTGGTYNINNFDQRTWTVRNQLIYNSVIRNGEDRINVQLGQEAREDVVMFNGKKLFGYNPDLLSFELVDLKTLAAGIFSITGRSVMDENTSPAAEERNRFNSLFALFNYTFKSKYSLDASWRRDQSNVIGSDKSSQNKPVWSVGGKWELGKESFMRRFGWINSAALRATYGITGNAPNSGGSSYFDVLSRETIYNTVVGPGAVVNTAANRKRDWESTKNYNIGLDFSVLKSRLNAGIDVYWRNTTGLLGLISTNPFSGFSRVNGNIGKITNKGVEVMLQSVNIRSRNFEWMSSLTFSYNYNRLKSYNVSLAYLDNTPTGKVMANQYFEGYAMNPLFGYRYGGLDSMGDPLLRLSDNTVSKEANAATIDDIIYGGTQTPRYNGGLMNVFKYRQFSLQVNTIYNLGHVMRKDINTLYNGRITANQAQFTGNISTYFLDRWKTPGDEAFTDVPRYMAGESPLLTTRKLEYYTLADRNIVSASYVKVRDITLSYTLPKSWLQRVKMNSANLFVQATNFMVWKANDNDIDPEFHNLYDGTRQIPPYKHSYSIGTNVSF